MFKIISSEIKKTVSKPGIYILSVLLAIILVLGVLIYKPTISESSAFELEGSTFIEKHTDFTKSGNAGKRAESQAQISNAIQSIENYTITVNNETYSQKEYIESVFAKFEEIYDAYQDCASDNSHQTHINTVRETLVSSVENLNDAIESAFLVSNENSYPILSTKSNYNKYKDSYKKVLAWAKITVEKENLINHFIEFESKYKTDLYDSISSFKYPTLKESFVEDFTSNKQNTKLSILYERLDQITNSIEELYLLAQSDSSYNSKCASEMEKLANTYVNTVNTFTNLVKYELIVNAYSNVSSTKEELQILHLSNYSNYNAKSLLERYNYLFNHNDSEADYARPLTIGITSNNKINAYDYSYFILKVFAFVIIVYAIMSACHSIAGEIKEGSMRYLAIRPVSRTKLFFGKWLSIIVMSAILMAFSFVISICVGGAVYGMDSNTILAIFNGNHAFTIHPVGMILIYLISMMLELIVYSLIAMLLSVLFKSDLMSMTILIVVYLINTLLPIFVQGANTWLAYYPFSHISLYSLFGSAVYGVSQNFFNLIFGSKIYAGTHIALTISMIALISTVVGIIAVKLFKRKEL